jgi:hypothetical protein
MWVLHITSAMETDVRKVVCSVLCKTKVACFLKGFFLDSLLCCIVEHCLFTYLLSADISCVYTVQCTRL